MPRPRINIIVAMANNRVIGRDGDLPWRISADLKRFKSITMGHPIVMGRKTFESLPRGPLPGRRNIIVSRHADYHHDLMNADCVLVSSLSEATEAAEDHPELMIIGGAAIYAAALTQATRLFLTEVHATIEGDVFFPTFCRSEWTETWRSARQLDAQSSHEYSFLVLEKA